MAKSKTTTTAAATKAKKAAAPKAKKAAPAAKAKAAKAAAPKASADGAAKVSKPKTAVKKTVAKAVVKKVAPVKLTDKQTEFLKSISSAGADGYMGDKKAEAKSLESLLGKKLIKKGAKDKATGAYRYTVSKAGEKHLGAGAAPASA